MPGRKFRPYFTPNHEYRIISFFETNAQLWNRKLPAFGDTSIKRKLREDLASVLGPNFTENDVACKWKALCDYFKAELRREKNGRKNGSGYISRWKHYNRLQFLKDGYLSRETVNTQLQQVEVENENENVEEEIEIDHSTTEDDYSTNSSPANNRIAKKRKYDEDELMMKAIKILEDCSTKKSEDDEYDLFGKQIAVMLRKMPPNHRQEAQLEIVRIIYWHRQNAMSLPQFQQLRNATSESFSTSNFAVQSSVTSDATH